MVPTQLLGFADGTMSQGFSTLYDMKLLSTYDGSLYDGTAKENLSEDGGQYSYLLVKGTLLTKESALRIQGLTGGIPVSVFNNN